MNDESLPESPPLPSKPAPSEGRTVASSSLYRMAEEMISLREITKRQLKMFEKTLCTVRDDIFGKFNSHVADQQRAYQQLRGEIHGEKRVGLNVLNEILDVCFDLERIVRAKPAADDKAAVQRWIESVEIESRKVQESVKRHGIQPYDAVLGEAYNPAIHERVGSRRQDGMDGLRVAEQVEHGFASQQPEFVLRRAKVIVSE
jgi:molecular chaperone GrpE (heat shock protein)